MYITKIHKGKEGYFMDLCLTKDADALISVLYKAYLQELKNNVPKGEAKYLGDSAFFQSEYLPKWDFERVDETCRELDRGGFLECLYADDVVNDAVITDKAIIYMEQRFKNGLNELLDYLQKIRSILLG
jgi:hypothetical protein